MNALELRDLKVRNGKFSLEIGHLDIERGGIYSVVGPNGSGKTTLLNLLSFMQPPADGTISLFGEEVQYANTASLLAARGKAGYLLQNSYLFSMSALRNVELGLKMHSVPAAERRTRVHEVMDQLGILHLAERRVSTLSGGEAQRVALARTVVMARPILLLDEPTAGIDLQNVHAVESTVKRLVKETGTTVLVSTHSRDQACRLSRDIISIIDGKVRDIDYENVFAGVLTVDCGTRSVRLTDNLTIRIGHGTAGPVTVAIDPGDILLSNSEFESSALNKFSGTITRVDAHGDSLRVFISCGAELCAEITMESFKRMKLSAGASVWATFKANAAKVL